MKTLLATLVLTIATAIGVQAQNATMSNAGLLAKNEYQSLAVNNDESAAAPAYIMAPSPKRHSGDPIGKNIVTGSPLNLVVVNNYGCYAFGFTYERLLGNQEVVGIQIPVHFAFGNDDWLGGNEGRFFFTTPGVQFHVAGAKRRFDYSVGPSLLLGNLYERDEYYNGNFNQYRETNTFTSGILLDNNLNFQRSHFLFGIHAMFGTTWWNSNYPNQFFMQLGIRVGGRF